MGAQLHQARHSPGDHFGHLRVDIDVAEGGAVGNAQVARQPLEMGVDVVIHSATKYLNGHSDVTGGTVSGPRTLVQRVDLTRRSASRTLQGA